MPAKAGSADEVPHPETLWLVEPQRFHFPVRDTGTYHVENVAPSFYHTRTRRRHGRMFSRVNIRAVSGSDAMLRPCVLRIVVLSSSFSIR